LRLSCLSWLCFGGQTGIGKICGGVIAILANWFSPITLIDASNLDRLWHSTVLRPRGLSWVQAACLSSHTHTIGVSSLSSSRTIRWFQKVKKMDDVEIERKTSERKAKNFTHPKLTAAAITWPKDAPAIAPALCHGLDGHYDELLCITNKQNSSLQNGPRYMNELLRHAATNSRTRPTSSGKRSRWKWGKKSGKDNCPGRALGAGQRESQIRKLPYSSN